MSIVTPKTEIASEVYFTAALLKVASRCNLNCDYCYVFHHADQSWRMQPRFMADATIERFAQRLHDYLSLHELAEFSVTFHGGEPLLYGGERIVSAAQRIRKIAGQDRSISFSLQSNGTLLTEKVIELLETAGIDVSVSLDGPRELHDRHRPNHNGNSTFNETLKAIQNLQQRKSKIFTGVIAVIDPSIAPRQLFEFFIPMGLPRLDLLLPDSTYERLPRGRDKDPFLYSNWLREAFELWFYEFSKLPIRWFDAVLASRMGVPSPTDAMGLGSVNLIVIDTDGSYSDHDVFKITAEGRANLANTLWEKSFEEISRHPSINEHCFRLTLPGLTDTCQKCPVVDACGGGSVMHRWHPTLGFDAPSVYCPELFQILETATKALRQSLDSSSALESKEIVPVAAGDCFTAECLRWRSETERRAKETAIKLNLSRKITDSAAAILLSERSDTLNFVLQPRERENVIQLGSISIHSPDQRLIAPYLSSVRLLPRESPEVQHGIAILPDAISLLSLLDPKLPVAFASLISDILFVESTIESKDQIFSFSDDTSPNVLYVAPFVGNTALDFDDLGDSLFHEFLHHVLYHMERDEPMLYDHVYPRFPAPWRTGLRPAGGFLHGTFVFAGLSQYWNALARSGSSRLNIGKCSENSVKFAQQASYGIKSLRQFALITPRGEAMLEHLATVLNLDKKPMQAPFLHAFSNAYEKASN